MNMGSDDNSENVPDQVELISKERLLDDLFKVDAHLVRHQKFDGTMSQPVRTLVFERGDAAAALLYNPSARTVVLVNQFRLPTLGKLGGRGWLTETTAGMIRTDDGEDAEDCIIREIAEETGYQVTRLTPVAEYFSSPGGSTELIHLFYAEVRVGDRRAKGGGQAGTSEDIQIEEYPLNLFLQMLANREFRDPKVIIAGQWLRDRQNRRTELAKSSAPTEFTVLGSDGKESEKKIGYISGDIAGVTSVDVWVNPENTDMIMDRFFGRSISAAIRYHGAKKYQGTHRVEQDTIGDALKAEMRNRTFVKPAYVLNTTAGELARTHNVRRIFHVAAAYGQIGGDSSVTGEVAAPIGKGVATNLKILEDAVINVLSEIEVASNWPTGFSFEPYRSVLFPIMGTGESGLFVDEVADRLVAKAVEFFEKRPKAQLQKIYFLAYSAADENILDDIMRTAQGGKLKPPADE